MSFSRKKHKRKRTRSSEGTPAEVPMTPMIDVVFQLLIYFIVTFEPEDVMAHLDVFTPSPEKQQEQPKKPDVIRVMVLEDGFTMNERPVGDDQMLGYMKRLADLDKNQTILIEVAPTSPHVRLVTVLDYCARFSLKNLSVVSIK